MWSRPIFSFYQFISFCLRDIGSDRASIQQQQQQQNNQTTNSWWRHCGTPGWNTIFSLDRTDMNAFAMRNMPLIMAFVGPMCTALMRSG